MTLATHPVKMTTDLAGAVLPNPVLTASGCAAAGRELQPFAPVSTLGAVVTKTMPFGNKTGITDQERALLGAWVDQGASMR